MTHELKFRYIYGIPGQPETYFARYFTIEEIESNDFKARCFAYTMDRRQGHSEDFEIISRDQFTDHQNLYENDIVEVESDEIGTEIPRDFKGVAKYIETGFYVDGIGEWEGQGFNVFQEITVWKVIGNTHGVKL